MEQKAETEPAATTEEVAVRVPNTRGAGSVYQEADGSWRATYRDRAGKIHRVRGRTRAEAAERRAAKLTELEGGAPEPDSVLREVKLGRPLVRPGTVSRAPLVDRLVAAAGLPLVVMSAPVGYGKTTLLAEWSQRDDRRFVWVTLERADARPVPLLTLIAEAVALVRPLDRALFGDLRSPGVSVLGRIVPRLVAAVRSAGDPFVLVLRNVHEITSNDSQDAVELLVSNLPAGVQIVAASRQPVWLATPGRRARGEMVELGLEDLAFEVDEARLLFDSVGTGASPGDVEHAVQLTEGWPAGLYLSALALRSARRSGRGDVERAAHPFISELIRAEALRDLPPSAARFLRRTSVLTTLSGSLCDAVLGSSGSTDHLRSIARSNLFVQSIDARHDWYRVHPLFRAVLHDELVRREAELEPALHRRAALWWEAHGAFDVALAHLRAAGDHDAVGRMVSERIVPTYLSGGMTLVETWLDDLGEMSIDRDPWLTALAGWIAALGGHAVEAARWADHSERHHASAEHGEDPRLTSLRLMLSAALCRRGVAAMATDAEMAVEFEPEWSVWRNVAVGILAAARWLSGDERAAELLFGEAVEAAEAAHAAVPLARWLAHRAVLLMDQGDWDRAAADISRALEVVDTVGLSEYGAVTLVYAARARLQAHRGDHDAARIALATAMRLRSLVTWAIPWHAALVRLEMADVHLSLADPGPVTVLVRELDEILHHRPDIGLGDRVARVREQVRHVRERAVRTLSAAELRLLPYLQTHLSLQEIADRLYVSRNTVSSEAGSIYRKLGVGGRSEAVEVACRLGLLASIEPP